MRVALRSQYSNFLYNLQNTQSRLMDLNMQASSQKRINKPSDDPVGTARVLNYRSSIEAIAQYQKNIDTGLGWLNLADETLMQTSTILTRLKGLAEQGSTGTLKASDREAIAYEARNLLGQLINLSNTRYENNSIFGGHKFESSAYEEGLMVYDQDGQSMDSRGLPIVLESTGAASHSILVQFVGTGVATIGTNDIDFDYRFSKDGGTTWKTKTLAADATKLDLDGVDLTLRKGYEINLSPIDNEKTSQGSWLTIAPTAIYKGDHETQAAISYDQHSPSFEAVPLGGFEQDVEVKFLTGESFGSGDPLQISITLGDSQPYTVEVSNNSKIPVIPTPYGGIQLLGAGVDADTNITIHAQDTAVRNLGEDVDVNARAQGVFTHDVVVRVDEGATIGGGSSFDYSYSIDGGVTWSQGHRANNSQDPAELLVPGGKLLLSKRGTSEALIQGDQFVIHPHTAAHNIEITTNEYLQINNIGSTIFGGYYEHGLTPVFSSGSEEKNIFVTVGKLVAALENNDQQACGQALESLEVAHEYLGTKLASVGGRENRLTVANAVLTGLKLNETERMSNVEDVDLATLMTELTNQQWAYEAVLRSSSMIMRMSLLNYL